MIDSYGINHRELNDGWTNTKYEVLTNKQYK